MNSHAINTKLLRHRNVWGARRVLPVAVGVLAFGLGVLWPLAATYSAVEGQSYRDLRVNCKTQEVTATAYTNGLEWIVGSSEVTVQPLNYVWFDVSDGEQLSPPSSEHMDAAVRAYEHRVGHRWNGCVN